MQFRNVKKSERRKEKKLKIWFWWNHLLLLLSLLFCSTFIASILFDRFNFELSVRINAWTEAKHFRVSLSECLSLNFCLFHHFGLLKKNLVSFSISSRHVTMSAFTTEFKFPVLPFFLSIVQICWILFLFQGCCQFFASPLFWKSNSLFQCDQ